MTWWPFTTKRRLAAAETAAHASARAVEDAAREAYRWRERNGQARLILAALHRAVCARKATTHEIEQRIGEAMGVL